MGMRAGDRVIAKPGTTSAIWAGGRVGRIAEVRDPKPYSGNDSNNLVRWGDDLTLVGFNPDDVELAPMTEEEVERAHDRAASEPPAVVYIVHHEGCRPDYPEKPEGEKPREIQEVDLEDGYKAWVCKDCGASTSTLPPLEDPYWDDVREEIER